MKGFSSTYLEVDLKECSSKVRKIEDRVLKTWLGGKGLGTYLLLRALKPGIDPLSADNLLILTPGIAAGAVPGTSRYGVYAKSPLTHAYGESYSGGSLAPAFKATGYDAVILKGRCIKPSYLVITSEGVDFEDAQGLWGLSTYEAEEGVLKEVGEKKARALVIGPAGENLVRFACINNDRWRNAGRCGMGAVMGSKNMKAVVFHGVWKPEFGDTPGLKEFTKRLIEKGKRSKGVENFRKYGTLNMTRVLNNLEGFPRRYWTRGKAGDIEKISAEYLVEEMEARPKACYNCFIACGKLAKAKKRHAGLEIEGPEYETAFAFGGLCAIKTLEGVALLNDLCDSLGMDTITAGSLIAMVMEAVKRGRIEHELVYGDTESAVKLLRDIAYRRGLGGVLADGVKNASEKLGLPDLAVHVKGLDPPGYDPRILKGMGLAYGTGSRGACHLRSAYYRAELSGKSPKVPEEKAKQYVEYEDLQTLYDSIIMCKFYGVVITNDEIRQLLWMLTGINYETDELERTANRIATATRVFNMREGLTMTDDALPKRFHSEPLKGKVLGEEEYRAMLRAYYKLRNWSKEGVPIRFGWEL